MPGGENSLVSSPQLQETIPPAEACPAVVGATASSLTTEPPHYDNIPPPKGDFLAPPPYDVATALPTYEDVQRQKLMENQQPCDGGQRARTDGLSHLHLLHLDLESGNNRDSLLGTEFVFLMSFFVAFFFNWVGFLLSLCFCHTVAGRYGALAGFGLSLAKWTLIVRHSTDLVTQENSWLCWIILLFGLLICVRATYQYLRIKYEWHNLNRAAQDRLLFFY